MTEYIVLEGAIGNSQRDLRYPYSSGPKNFHERCEDLLADGWSLQGGVSVADGFLYQAFAK